ncbi:hypothetical protein JDW15_01960 [Aerococcaceae bacterium zg-ZJ1578]|uniref:hypothetical protein n=1 Tax=Aerococcaceae TaxID=186827 RepID=UPI0013B63618|nr:MULTISPECIES: hypothetical protein [unclassified Facklamia]MBK0347401.1 hypothetical protein [Aerococcaceae bacterium zg-1578]MBR7926979.1 hypothetical protein [Aerococcaceae bacterium zg-ZUI334]MBS4461829.1 hypothetical protein [Aerococcaceae bacterium zg-B36]QQD66348.1 hypothetical protein JDW14_04430 [Aerococcaceae bacterium zg-252]NEW63636.1 hypothetical protein [Facklamia sp. 252]
MDIWILVIAFLAIAIVLLIASFYASDDNEVLEQLENLQTQHSQELFAIKTRISEIEQELSEPMMLNFGGQDSEPVEEVPLEIIELNEISDLTKEEVIRLYSQGFTMKEIANDVTLNVKTVQLIVDDYIENR